MVARKTVPKRVTATGKKRVVIVKSAAYVNRVSNTTKKKPSPRLKSRRAANTVQGRYPNPVDDLQNDALRIIDKAMRNTEKSTESNSHLENIRRQAAISYAQGVIEGFYQLGVIKPSVFQMYIKILAALVK